MAASISRRLFVDVGDDDDDDDDDEEEEEEEEDEEEEEGRFSRLKINLFFFFNPSQPRQ